MTARTVSRQRAELLSAFHDADAVRVDLHQQLKMDVCGVQLIESARKFAGALGKSFSLTSRPSDDLIQLLDQLGVIAPSTPDRRAFWLNEGARA